MANDARGWLEQRVEDTRLLAKNMLMVRRSMMDKGPKNAKRPPRARPNSKPPDKSVLPDAKLAAGYLVARSNGPASLLSQVALSMGNLLAPWLGDSSPSNTAESLILLGDDHALKRWARQTVIPRDQWKYLAELAVDRGQAECLLALLTMHVQGLDEYEACIGLLEQAIVIADPIPRVIHALCAWIYQQDSSFFPDTFSGRVKSQQIFPSCDANTVAMITWMLEEDDPLSLILPTSHIGLFSAPMSPRYNLFRSYRMARLYQHKLECDYYTSPIGGVLEAECTLSHLTSKVDIVATEKEASLLNPEEVYWELEEEKKTRSGRSRGRGEWKRKSRAGDIEYLVPQRQLEEDSPFMVQVFNQKRDILWSTTHDETFLLCLGECDGAVVSDISTQYVLDGSLWPKPSEEDLRGVSRDTVTLYPAAVIVVSIDTGSIVGYLSYVDDEFSNGVSVVPLVPRGQREYDLEEHRTRPLGYPSYSGEPARDDGEHIQSFMADVRETAIICVANCSALFVHYTSSETMWNSAMSIIPYEKRQH